MLRVIIDVPRLPRGCIEGHIIPRCYTAVNIQVAGHIFESWRPEKKTGATQLYERPKGCLAEKGPCRMAPGEGWGEIWGARYQK